MSQPHHWLRRLLQRRDERRGVRASRHGRPLRFEHCEPRLALSTTTLVMVDPSDVISFEAIGMEGGTIAWDVVPLSLTKNSVSGVQILFDLAHDQSYSIGKSVEVFDLQNRTIGNADFLMMDGGELAPPDLLMGDLDEVGAAYSGSPIKPIDPPGNEQQGREGGAIALAPFTSPDSFGRFDRESQFADHQRVPSKALERGLSARQVPTSEGMRGRAVVFEVAQVTSPPVGKSLPRSESTIHESKPTEEAVLAARDAAFDSPRPADKNATTTRTHDAVAQLTSRESRAAVRVTERLLAQAAEPLPVLAATDLNGNDVEFSLPGDDSSGRLNIVDHASRDAALSIDDGTDQKDVTIETPPPVAAGLRDRTLIGVALALVAGYRPATKFARGRRGKSATEQRPPRQRA